MASWVLAAVTMAAEMPADAGVLAAVVISAKILASVALASEAHAAIAMDGGEPSAGVLAVVGLPVVVEAVVG